LWKPFWKLHKNKSTKISKNSPDKSNNGAEITTVWKTKNCT